MSKTDKIVHICQQQDWQKAVKTGAYQAESLADEGFIHCSRPEQVLEVVNTFYKDVPDLVLLWINPKHVRAEIRWENVDGDEFPHIYGSLNVDAVIDVGYLVPDEDGIFRTLPPLVHSSTNPSNKLAI